MDQPLTTTIAAIKTQTPTCSQQSIHENVNQDATHISPNRSNLHFYQLKTPFAKNLKSYCYHQTKTAGHTHTKSPWLGPTNESTLEDSTTG